MANRTDIVRISLLTGAATIVATPATIAALTKFAVLDVPNARSSHTNATPRGGGLACLAGGGLGYIFAKRLGLSPGTAGTLGATAMAAVGFADDIKGLSPSLRLAAQVLVGSCCGGVAGGWRLASLGALTMPVVVNSVNFMDGINGITGTTLLAWGVSTGNLARSASHSDLSATTAIASGVAIGFLPWNMPNASIFLGDVGSYMIGGMISCAALEATERWGRRGYFAVLAPLTYYFGDTGLTILFRLIKRQRLFDAHREHAYQRLVSEVGFEHWQVSMLTFAAALSGGALAQTSRFRPILALFPAALAVVPRLHR